MNFKPSILATIFSVSLFFVTMGTSARADTTNACSPTQVQFDGTSLYLWCANDGNGPYSAYLTGTNAKCPTQPEDTLKIWYSMMTSAQRGYKDKSRTTHTMSLDYTPRANPNNCWAPISSLRLN
jgi:hypothetical protein